MGTIFISSTCYDLIDLRAELKEYISSLGLTPVMSDQPETEFVTFADQNSIETCLINLRSSDVVLLILSQRYGPSLEKAGFTNHSATHLEYLEAIKLNKKVLFFVRDRLEADYTNHKKTGNENSLVWIDKKEKRLFEIIDEHKKLQNADVNNWYWSFKNSIDLKSRLKIDLKAEIQEHRLHQLINSGNMPMLTIDINKCEKYDAQANKLILVLKVSNMGNQSAIDPNAIIFKAKSYKDVIENNLEKSFLNYELVKIPSMGAGQSFDTRDIILDIAEYTSSPKKVWLVIDIVFKTIYGDLISDISEIDIDLDINLKPDVRTRYNVKRYRNGTAYEKITERDL